MFRRLNRSISGICPARGPRWRRANNSLGRAKSTRSDPDKTLPRRTFGTATRIAVLATALGGTLASIRG